LSQSLNFFLQCNKQQASQQLTGILVGVLWPSDKVRETTRSILTVLRVLNFILPFEFKPKVLWPKTNLNRVYVFVVFFGHS